MTFFDGGADVDALRTDRYLETLLTSARGTSEPPADAALDPDIRSVAARLRRHLVPVHPSFRFEERLAARLAEAARSMSLADAAGAEGAPIPLATGADVAPFDEVLADESPVRLGRPLLIGGALTSAALSLAGAAYVAWRRNRAARGVRGVRGMPTGVRRRLD